MLSYHEIELRVRPLGMRLRGGFYDEDEGRSYLLVGNVGSEIWPIFSKDHNDWNEPHPLDKWTRNKLTPIADEIGALVVFPFDGPEFAPFQKWAMRADCVFPSPVGPLIHPEFGLWHAYRAAFIFMDEVKDIPQRVECVSPCVTCNDKPCLHGCPVDAFSEGDYNVSDCVDHLASDNLGNCMTKGCLARRSCPVGEKYIYEPLHADFHMNRFVMSDFIH